MKIALLRTGSRNDMEEIQVLLDELSLKLIENWFLLGTSEGVLDQESLKITGISPLMTVANFKSGLKAPLSASLEITGLVSGDTIPDQDTILLSDTMQVQIKGKEDI